jgi:phosphohistidine swiveling domain-containing protein
VGDRNKVIDQFLGNASTPIEWASEEEKQLHFWYDDLHCPQPTSPMWFDVAGWWLTCNYMFRRFGVPFGKDWVAKTIKGYVHSAVVPRDPKEEAELAPYYNMVMPVYANKFLDWWRSRYLPEIKRNFEFLDSFPMDTASLPELMILLEDGLDIQERHFRLHWVLNLAQFQTSLTFEQVFKEMIGEEHAALIGSILVSDEDRNWDSVRDLWKLKEKIKSNEQLKAAFKPETAPGVMKALAASEDGRGVLSDIDAYKMEYGNKSMYTHEYLGVTWRENPTPIVEALRGYLLSDYDYPKDVRQLRESRDAAIADMWSRFPKEHPQADRDKLQGAMDLALGMTPLTPDHHFYMDQGTYARLRLVFMAAGRKLVQEKVLDQPDDVFFLLYHELRVISANFQAFDAKALSRKRRDIRQAAFNERARYWVGTITEWSMNDEPYKQGLWGWPDIYYRERDQADQPRNSLRGLGASAGIVEGIARVVSSPEQFNQVTKGDILVCKMTNPAWVVVFTKIGGLITDAGGALSHPAVVSREFGIPAVVGTAIATDRIKTGQRVRVNGAAGTVEILD